MTVARSEDDFQEIRDEDLAKKMKLEVPFARSMNTFLRKVNSDFAQQYIADGSVVDAFEYKSELVALLALNYKRISNAFKFNIRESFTEKTSKEINAIINTDITKFARNISNRRSDLILSTTNREIAKELVSSFEELIDAEKEINNLNVANLTRKNLNERAPGRATIISIAETQNMSESSKDIEEKDLITNDVVIGGVILSQVLKDVWITTLDERTRVSHVNANLQEKNPFESFLVGGEFLRYPGDPGGRADNIIGCRCSKVTKIF